MMPLYSKSGDSYNESFGAVVARAVNSLFENDFKKEIEEL